jgi:1-acyl-sn-glycerol-3-phosphate acyltransferase
MPPPVQLPDDTPRVVDRFILPFGLVFGVALSLFLLTPGENPLPRAPAFFGGWLVGLLLPRILRHHPYRALGFIPWAGTAVVAVVLAAELGVGWAPWMIGLFAVFEGTAVGALLRFRDRFRAGYRRFLVWAGVGGAAGVAVIAAFAATGGSADWIAVYRGGLIVGTVGVALLGWLTLLRPTIECTVEVPMRIMYRVSVAGPGRDAVPPGEPFVVIANHASWFDPLMLAMNVTPPVIPMMTSGFYDLPVLRWLMAHVFRTIRVLERAVRRETPEVEEAIAALDARRCVVVFPEGYLRRKEDQVLRRFGQGIWHLLKARPRTPVLPCWLDGVWGSYSSHAGGPPTKNKRFDLRRPVRIGMAAAVTVPPEVLADPMRTRIYLMNRVLDARKHLGLPDVPPVEFETATAENDHLADGPHQPAHGPAG